MLVASQATDVAAAQVDDTSLTEQQALCNKIWDYVVHCLTDGDGRYQHSSTFHHGIQPAF